MSPSFHPLAMTLHPCQWQVFACEARFRVLVAGRRFGKTHLALVEMLEAALDVPGRIVWYVGPNNQQARLIAWDRLKKMTQPFWAKKPNETKMRIDLQSGSVLIVHGAYYPDSLRGVGVNFLVIDESALLHPRAWTEVFRPAVADRKGRVLFISTPKGHNHFYRLYEHASSGAPNWAAFQFSTAQGGLVDQEELESAAHDLDEQTYQQELEGKFVNTVLHRVYQTFEPSVHVKPVGYDYARPLVWSLDFNIDPMCMLIMQRAGEMTHVLEEIVIKNATTEVACQRFFERATLYLNQTPMWQRPLKVNIYGDSSGGQRRTSGAQTDWALVKESFAYHRGVFEPKFLIPGVNPLVRDRVNCVKSRLRNLHGDSRLLIDPQCTELIRDLEDVSWAVNASGAPTNELNKSDKDRTHLSDALGYFIAKEFPMLGKIGEKKDGSILSF